MAAEIISRKAARSQGLKRFFTGNPCLHGHLSERCTKDGRCYKCVSDRSLAWHKQNKNRHNENAQRWVALNKKKNQELKRDAEHRRRARVRGSSGGNYTAQDLVKTLTAQAGRCIYCKCSLRRRDKHIDHIMPLARGGSNDRTNIQYLCRACNQSKAARHPVEYARAIGLLF